MKSAVYSIFALTSYAVAIPFAADPSASPPPHHHGPTIDKRVMIMPHCNATQTLEIQSALEKCAAIARAAQVIGQSDYPAVEKYFRNTKSIPQIHIMFRKVSLECRHLGRVSLHCGSNTAEPCKTGHLLSPDENLFTSLPDQRTVVVCPSFFKLPPAPQDCHGNDRATAFIDELTNFAHVGSTEGHAFRYEQVLELDGEKALKNGASFGHYATEVWLTKHTKPSKQCYPVLQKKSSELW